MVAQVADQATGQDELRTQPPRLDALLEGLAHDLRRREEGQHAELLGLAQSPGEVPPGLGGLVRLRSIDAGVAEVPEPDGELLGREPGHRLAEGVDGLQRIDEVAEPMIEDGLPLLIATLGAIYGPGDKDYGGTPRTAFQDYLRGDLPMVPRDFAFPWVYVEDTARSLHCAMEAGAPGEEYILGDGARSLAEAFEVTERITGVPTPRTVSPGLFRWLGRAVAGVELVTRPPAGFESELLRFFGSGERLEVDGSKAERELGVEYRSLEAGLEEYLEWELEQLDLQLPTG